MMCSRIVKYIGTNVSEERASSFFMVQDLNILRNTFLQNLST